MEGNIESSDHSEVRHKVESLEDADLQRIWDALDDYDPNETADNGMPMDDWATLIASEMDRRGMSKN